MRRRIKLCLLWGLTSLGILLGGIAIFMIFFKQAYILAAALILSSAIIDRYDGRLARYYALKTGTGKVLDTVNDLVSFTLAPMSLIFSGELFHSSLSGVIFSSVFILSAIFRLFRYHREGRTHHFKGLPTTLSGLVFVLIFLLVRGLTMEALNSGFFYGGLIIGLSALMISRLRFPKL